MKTHFIINVYILTDSQGEWWETLKTDGSLRRFKPGQAEPLSDKTFTTADKAKRFAEAKGREVFQVLKLTPPVSPSRTWGQEVVYQVGKPKPMKRQPAVS